MERRKKKKKMMMMMMMMIDDDDDDDDAWQWCPTSTIGAKRAGVSYLLANWEPEKKQRGWKCNEFVSSPEEGLSSQQPELLKAFEGKHTIQGENGGPKQKIKRGGNRKQTNE